MTPQNSKPMIFPALINPEAHGLGHENAAVLLPGFVMSYLRDLTHIYRAIWCHLCPGVKQFIGQFANEFRGAILWWPGVSLTAQIVRETALCVKSIIACVIVINLIHTCTEKRKMSMKKLIFMLDQIPFIMIDQQLTRVGIQYTFNLLRQPSDAYMRQ